MEQFIGVCFCMSIHVLPKPRLYWNTQTRVEMVARTMSLNRWENIKRNLHFADNNNQVPGGDKLFKVRPLLNFLNDSFRGIPMDGMLCVDEQMVPFKRKSQLKQYIPMKPKRWGYKIFILADQHGIVYRLAGCTFMDDQAMKAKGRGTQEEKMASHNGVNLFAVKWFDNRPVTLLSTFVAANPTTQVLRWDKKEKEIIRVSRPSVVAVCNKSMGGVDLLDSLIAL
ncbi:piggyBac transposable element-derived protein 3-like [Sparus aurata]|uniref:piggyBac transposable element-derived protein 3-like n=1 Tax=Sparus aurata TaxID=8175 RepID=UPI0011C1C02C|nr:piggyBac transposable element-derived protein 3-like [Sparus aurata]